MPSCADLIDRLCDEAKLNGAAASADRARALRWLQEGAERACSDAKVPVTSEASVSLTAGDPTYTLDASPFPTDMVALLDVTVTDSAVTGSPVTYITPHEMQARRNGSGVANSTPYEYSGDWPNFVVWPPPAASTTLTITYLAAAPTLADGSTQLSFVPPSYLYGCVFEIGMMRALQFKNDDAAAKDRWGAYQTNLRGLKLWAGSAMARQGAAQPSMVSPVFSTSQDLGF